MTYRGIGEVEAALATKLPEAMTEKNYDGFTTVSWSNAARVLDQVFGPFGWSDRVVASYSDGERGVYTVTRELTVHALDESGAVLSKTVTGVGTSVATVRKGEDTPTGKAHKTAAMGAASIAFAKATKLLGDAFGLYLYDEDEKDTGAAPARKSSTATGKIPSRKGNNLSEKQVYSLKQAGIDEGAIDTMTYETGKALLDLYFDGGRKPLVVKGKMSAKVKALLAGDEPEDDEDDESVPF